jgi:glucose-induced degradation protein 8
MSVLDSDDDSQEVPNPNPLPSALRDTYIPISSWNSIAESHTLSKQTMNNLIMKYFILEGFKDAALEFSKEAFVNEKCDIDSITRREDVRNRISSGDILIAVELLNQWYPKLFDDNQQLLLQMYQQHFVELIVSRSIYEAMSFAKDHIAPLALRHPALLKDIEQIMCLALYGDHFRQSKRDLLPSVNNNPPFIPSPVRRRFDVGERHRLASTINMEMLKAEGSGTEPEIALLLKTVVTKQNKLKKTEGYDIPWIHNLNAS